MTEVNLQDQCAAEEWAVRMLDDPGRHQHDLGKWIDAKPGRGALYDRLMRDLDDATAAVRVAPVQSHRPVLMRARKKLLAVAFLCACLIIGFSLRFTASQSPRPIARPMLHLATKIGELRRVMLADGSSVILDTDTFLTIDFSGQRRLLTLRHGRARFSVAHDKARPFVVHAGGGEIVATGTVFDVACREALSVDLLQGRVVVRPPSTSFRPRSLPPIALNSGQHIAFDPGHKRAPSVTATSVSETQWVQGTKSLNDVSINAIIAEANRYAAVHIELADRSLGTREVFGDIDVRDSDAVAEGIAAYLDLRVDRSQQGKIVLRYK